MHLEPCYCCCGWWTGCWLDLDAVGLVWSTVHSYRTHQQLEGHVIWKLSPSVPSGPLLLTTSSSSEHKRLVQENKKHKKWCKSKKGRASKRNAEMKKQIDVKRHKKRKTVVSVSRYPSQSLERTTAIGKPRVRFPVEVRICFGVKMWLRLFKWVIMR